MRQIEVAEEMGKRSPLPGRGRKGGDRALERQTGIDGKTIRETRRHVEKGEEFPAMHGNGWREAVSIDRNSVIDLRWNVLHNYCV